MRRITQLLVCLVFPLVLACGGDTTQPVPPPAPPPPGPPPPPPPPAPVATVTVDPGSASIVVQQTLPLTATLRDAGGAALSGRTIAWSSSQTAVASVSASGIVTGVAPGATTITATSEGRSGTAQVTVLPGALVGPGGGTVFLADSAIRLIVPPGALSAPTTLTATLKSQPPAAPADWQVVGPVYALGPNGTVFSQPVTVTLKYDNRDLPDFVMSGDLAVLRHNGTQWAGLSDLAVDVQARTVSGRTTGFSDFGIGVEDPDVSLSPASASVNSTHRSAFFSVVVAPRGTEVPLPPGTLPPRFRWRTTGQNGVLSGPGPTEWTTTQDAQYTATAGALSQMSGKIDDVFVDVLLNPEALTNPQAGPLRIITAQAAVDADLVLTYDLTPEQVTIGAAQEVQFTLEARDKQGTPVPLANSQSVTWSGSQHHGMLQPGIPPVSQTATYKALNAEQFSTPPPRVDDVIAKVQELRTHTTREHNELFGASFNKTVERELMVDRGEAKTFVTVKVNYQISLDPPTDTVPAGGSLLLEVKLNPAYNGTGLRYRFSHSGGQGELTVAPGVLLEDALVGFEAGELATGTETI